MASTSTVPAGYQTVMSYLLLSGAEKFIEFTKQVFAATEKNRTMSDEKTVRHAEVVIGDSTIMFGEATDQWKAQPASLFIYVANADETYKKALAAGAKSVMELSDQSYGRTCGVQDPCGNTWWITTAKG